MAFKQNKVFILFGITEDNEALSIIGVFKCRVAAERRMNRISKIKHSLTDEPEDIKWPYYYYDFSILSFGVKQ